jgi:Kef-type K+ transport system membrane component KefB
LDILLAVTICLGLSLLLSELFRRHKYPEVIGQILTGIILGLPFFSGILSGNFSANIELLSQLGIVFLLLLAGMEINIKRLEKLGKDEFLIALMSAVIPFILGYWGIRLLGYDWLVAIVVGASLSITAEGTTLKVLMDLNQLNTKIGTIILGAGIIDDILEVLLLAMVLIIAENPAEKTVSVETIMFFPIMIVGFIAVCLLLFKFVPKFMRYIQKEHSRVANFSMVIFLGIGVAAISQLFGLGHIIGAFIAGVLIHWVNKEKQEELDIVEELRVMTFAFIIPFFFIYIGLHFDIMSIIQNPLMVLFVLVIAISGKILGSILAKFFLKGISFKQSLIIGWGMNSRGAIELVIAEIARSNGLIGPEIYSAIVIVAVVTTIIFPIVLRMYLQKYPKIMK